MKKPYICIIETLGQVLILVTHAKKQSNVCDLVGSILTNSSGRYLVFETTEEAIKDYISGGGVARVGKFSTISINTPKQTFKINEETSVVVLIASGNTHLSYYLKSQEDIDSIYYSREKLLTSHKESLEGKTEEGLMKITYTFINETTKLEEKLVEENIIDIVIYPDGNNIMNAYAIGTIRRPNGRKEYPHIYRKPIRIFIEKD